MSNGTFSRCAPDRFFDSGGGSGNYGSNENIVTTICTTNPDDFIILNFTSFSTQLNQDILTIYDGPDTSAPLIGTYSGGTAFSPGTVSASPANSSGCLTLQFMSNATGTTTGFAANILCAEPCQTITASIDSTNPVPSSGVITTLPGASVDFNGSATFSNNGTGATYSWNFGDGSPVTPGQSVSHTFNNPGTYNVTFTVTDTNPQGCSNTVTISVLVPEAIVSINNSAYTESSYTPQELVENVLVSGGCSAVDNFSFQVNGSPTNLQTKSYGYFNKGGAVNFPFEEGIVLSTGRAAAGGNIINGNLVSFNNGQAGDNDLEAALGQTDTNDATFIKFNFVPTGDTISFRYLMASEEYDGSTECSFADSFAFLLREVGTTAYTNLAVLPNGTPVSVTNINNSGNCTANPSFFAGYDDDFPNPINDTNYGGRTVVLTATASVTLGVTYEIKLVVADEGDSIWDSAIFLEAGSFNLGGELGDDITIAAGNAECDGSIITLDTQAPNATHIWYKDDVEIPGETDSTIDVNESGIYSVDVIFAATCQANDSIIVEFYPNFSIDSVQDLFLCNPGSSPYNFDLTENNPLILGSITDTTDYIITYHETQADADADTNAIPNMDLYSGTDGQTIFARLEYQSSECYDTDSFTLNIIDEPLINPVADLEICDDLSNDGFELFDLESQTATILGSQPAANFVVTYYPTFEDAEAETNVITSPFTNTSNPQLIYVRLESTGTNNCTTVSANPVFSLIVNERAIATQPNDLLLCDDVSNDGIEQFDLLQQTVTILGTQPSADYSVTYYESQVDAETGINPILNPATYSNTSNPQTIYVRVSENATPDCYGYTTFQLIVNPLPSVTMPSPLVECDLSGNGTSEFTLEDATNEALNGQTGVTVTYHETLVDAQSGTSALTSPYASGAQTIYIRLVNTTTGCYSTSTLDLIVNPVPVANAPTALEVCDDNTDGFTSFDLSLKDAEILNGQTGMEVTYHASQGDADGGDGDLSMPFTNTTAFLQTVFVRVEDIASNCYDTVELDLVVNSLPTISTVSDYALCDYDSPGDAQELFTLTDKDAEALNGQTGMDVSYHASEADALAGLGALTSPFQNISNPQTIYIRLENTLTGCVNTTTFDLIVHALPIIFDPAPLAVCDDNVPDGLTEIDLSVKDAEITGGNALYAVTYHFTQADADTGNSPLSVPYTNVTNSQTVYVRVVDTNTGCYDTTTLLLQVEQAPVANVPTPLEYCDPDNDGFGSFNLSDSEAEVTGGAPGLEVTYHETLANAENNVNPLPLGYDNIVAFAQTVYVRVVSSILTSDCATIVPLVLNVLPTPLVPLEISDYAICDINSDGFAQFDLTTKDPEILGSQDATQYTLTYHLTAADANSGTGAIVNVGNYTNSSNPQTVHVRLEGTNGCYKTGEFELIVNLPPVTFQPTELSLCDDEVADEMTSFDLTVKDSEITGGDGSLSVSYYATNADAQSDTNEIATATGYVNTSVNGNPFNPQTLYVRITDTDTGCTSFRTLTIRVLPNPEPMTDPSDIVLCDDTNTGDGQEAFDLTENEAYILDGAPGLTATYHVTLGDAESGTAAITDPTAYTNLNTDNTPQTIYVRVTNDLTGCYAVVDFDILVNPLPEAVAVTDYILCEVNTDGFAQFDLSSKDAEVLNGQDPQQFNVTYHATQADADNLASALGSPYTNTGSPQQIFVAITNVATGCSNSTPSFNIEVDNGAQANPNMEPIVQVTCDNLGGNDGLGQFDLTLNNAEVLDGQDPSNYTVTYYLTHAAAELGTDPIPNTYENTSSPQVIYVRVDNDEPDGAGMDSSICYAVAEVTLRVDLLPIFDLDDSYTLCVDTNGTEVIGPPILDTGLPAGDYTFVWSLDGTELAGETGPSLTASQGGTYSVVVTNSTTGCQNGDSADVMVSSPPVVNVEVATQAFSENGVIVATATGDGTYEYSLDNGPWQEDGTFEGVSFGEHTVTARDINGCGLASGTVTLLDYPKFFTPNGDGRNETWNIVGFADQPSTKIYIFDRFGKLLKQISPTGQGWNGTYNGEQMPTSDYWFTVEYVEPSTGQPKQFRAHFTLKR